MLASVLCAHVVAVKLFHCVVLQLLLHIEIFSRFKFKLSLRLGLASFAALNCTMGKVADSGARPSRSGKSGWVNWKQRTPHQLSCPVRKTGKSSYAVLKAEREEMQKRMEEMTDEIKQTKAHLERVEDQYNDLRGPLRAEILSF